jgi:hypothetical protein
MMNPASRTDNRKSLTAAGTGYDSGFALGRAI